MRRHGYAVAAAIVIALVGGSYAAKQLLSSGASTSACPTAAGWRGVRGVRLASTHPALERAVLARVNAFRRAHGRSPLVASERLAWAARYHSRDMSRRGVLEHERAGETFTQRFGRYSPSTCIAENIASGFVTARSVVVAWQESPGHRHVLLLAWIRRAGVGMVGRYVTFDASS